MSFRRRPLVGGQSNSPRWASISLPSSLMERHNHDPVTETSVCSDRGGHAPNGPASAAYLEVSIFLLPSPVFAGAILSPPSFLLIPSIFMPFMSPMPS